MTTSSVKGRVVAVIAWLPPWTWGTSSAIVRWLWPGFTHA